ncbi:RHS repeat-associated core domain-containing protein [Microbacterium hydrocarbonoxydans]|uniref:RHS repeat-associated core domain-containing protein n=1 Tax=Microbacterium hydrocarbonoxydans TaxID=273678 RepID=UPI00142895A3|nr:RHS repeat-associated core domain-containing protein [Microbacterium hydrocarbonoxydans]
MTLINIDRSAITTQADGRSTSYAYDGLDRRTGVTDQTLHGTDTTTTAWDGFEPAATDSDLHGVTSLFRDPLGAVAYQAGASGGEWVLGDQRNVTATAGANGQITDLVNYADFGGAEYESTGWASLVGNDQQPGDPTLGLDNYYARDYDPTTGSWVQPDDWRGLLVRPQSLNRYSYIENTPVSFSDDLGYVRSYMRASGGGNRPSVVKRAAAKAGAAAGVAARNAKAAAVRTRAMASLTRGPGGGVSGFKSTSISPRHRVSTPMARSAGLLPTRHLLTPTGCDRMDKNCGGNGNLFGWSDDIWRTIGATAVGVLVGIVVTAGAIAAAGCVVATLGACAGVIAAAAIIGGAAGGLASYLFATPARERTPSEMVLSTLVGAAGGAIGSIAGALISRVIAGTVAGVGSKSGSALGGAQVGTTLSRSQLNPTQLADLNRYTKRLPKGAGETTITQGADGTLKFSAVVPGIVPGSSAIYTKVVDASGKTIGYFKTTVTPDGSIAHIKDKFVK